MTTFMSVTDVRKDIYTVVKKAKKPGSPVVLTYEGQPEVVMMSFEEYEGWKETMEIMADPEMVAALDEANEELKTGRIHQDTVSLDDVRKELDV